MAGGSFSPLDYLVFCLLLGASAAVGGFHAWTARGTRRTRDFLLGGGRLSAPPVSLSLTASFMSAITMLSNPAEVYRFGANLGFYAVSYVVTVLLTSELFLPVFYRLAVTSTYQYLELRFSRSTRLLGTLLFILQTVLYTGIVIYAPALALNQVTGMDLWGAVVSTGAVCTFYSAMGGLKAVVWTDVIQLGVMLTGFLAVIVRAAVVQGGVSNIISHARAGGRLNFMDFDPSPLRRNSFWTLTVGGAFVWLSVYGVNQAQVQRYVSCRSLNQARLALYLNLLGLWTVLLCSVLAGLCLYSVYRGCDPWTRGLVSAPDQLMPYLVMDILGGFPGLFVAAVYSGSLSTVSSSINALAAVTVEDLVRPHSNMSEQQLSRTSKGLSLLYGVLCVGMAGLASLMGGILQATISIFGVIGGPLLGVFSLGILCPFANSKGALSGLASGLFLSLWLGIGAQLHPPPPSLSRPLPLSTAECNLTAPPLDLEAWYSLSYLYFSPVGTLATVAVGIVVSALTGGCRLDLQPGLTLRREDSSLHALLGLLRGGRRGELDLEKSRREEGGSSNPAFSDLELS